MSPVSLILLCLLRTAATIMPTEESKPDPFYDLQDKPKGYPNLEMKTAGGKQLWSDELVFHAWRIQRHTGTGHCRLLDENNRRHAWGNYPHCRQVLEKIKRERNLPPMTGQAVFVLHGLTRSRAAMQGLCDYVEQRGGYTVFNITYASTRKGIGRHAESLDRLVNNLDGVDEINFVAHSLGNLVIRHYLGDSSSTGRNPDPRIRRIVMLGPPNQGSTIARRMKNNVVFKTVWGDSGRELADNWDELSTHLAIPQCEFGIIAGGKRDDKGMNPLIKGDDDGVVSVAETKLPGAHAFIVVPVVHTVLMNDVKVCRYVVRFLKNGYFVKDEQ